MMDAVEKVVAGFGVTCVLAAGLFYLIVGTPSTTPAAFVPRAKRLPSRSVAEAESVPAPVPEGVFDPPCRSVSAVRNPSARIATEPCTPEASHGVTAAGLPAWDSHR